MTPEQSKAARERCEAATPGPWSALPKNAWMTGVRSDEKEAHCKIYHAEFHSAADLPDTIVRQRRDADFIANARTDLPMALDEIERLSNGRGAMFVALSRIVAIGCTLGIPGQERLFCDPVRDTHSIYCAVGIAKHALEALK